MKIGDYVRTKHQGIKRIDKIFDKATINKYGYETDDYEYKIIKTTDIIKSSPNIIDLIEVGDYVNGMLVTNIWIDKETGNIEFDFNNHESYLYPKSWNYESRITKYKIQSIVTKEQFESMEYKIC